MSANYRDLMKYAATGIASPDMTYYDRMRASTLMGGAAQTLTGIPPLTFNANGTPLISWSIKGNGQQTGTPTPDNPVIPTFCGVRTGNLFDGTDDSLVYIGYNLATTNVWAKGGSGICLRIPVDAQTQYTISGEVESSLFRVCACAVETIPTDDNSVSVTDLIRASLTRTASFTTPANTRYIIVQTNGGIMPQYRQVLMLNSGSTALPYEPYGYKIPFTCAGQTTPVYLGEVPTVRRIKKLVLTGEEIDISKRTSPENSYSISIYGNSWPASTVGYGMSSHFVRNGTVANLINGEFYVGSTAFSFRIDNCADAAAFKSYLAAQYAAGTPVTVWYVLAEPETGIVNEPLCKIGDYADELHSEDAAVTIPTANGQNTLTVETDLQPSEMTITGYIEESSPFPPDCPFECDLDYFIDDAIEWSIAERTYKKINTEYAVGAMIYIPPYHIGLLMSPVSAEAVAYTTIGRICYSTGSIDYNGKTWYYSSTDYAEIGETSGLPLYETPISYPYTQEQLTQFLQFIHAKNR